VDILVTPLVAGTWIY